MCTFRYKYLYREKVKRFDVCGHLTVCFLTGPEEKKVKSKKEKMKERRERWLKSEL